MANNYLAFCYEIICSRLSHWPDLKKRIVLAAHGTYRRVPQFRISILSGLAIASAVLNGSRSYYRLESNAPAIVEYIVRIVFVR